jgi:hypothetical protein
MWAAHGGHAACVQALVDAKAAVDIKDVSDARLFACLFTLESPSSSKLHKHLLKLVSCAVVFMCTNSSFVIVAFIWVIVASFCACARIKSIFYFLSQVGYFFFPLLGLLVSLGLFGSLGLLRILFS